jgi:hypothetical protein
MDSVRQNAVKWIVDHRDYDLGNETLGHRIENTTDKIV